MGERDREWFVLKIMASGYFRRERDRQRQRERHRESQRERESGSISPRMIFLAGFFFLLFIDTTAVIEVCFNFLPREGRPLPAHQDLATNERGATR